MTPETQAIFEQAFHEANKKWDQIEIDRIKKESIQEGVREGKESVAKNLKGKLSDEEISKITGISLEKVKSL